VTKLEREMMEALVRLVAEVGRPVTEEEALSAIVPPDQPRLRFKPSYKYCAARLARRGLLSATTNDLAKPRNYEPTKLGIAQLAES
jgi:hypothetical protein